MKSQRFIISVSVLILFLVLGTGLSQAQGPGPQAPLATQAALGTAFTYQGQLENSGSPYNGNCDFQFALYDAASGGTQIGTTQTASNVSVTNGLFTVAIDFGNAFNGDARWLDMAVRCPAGSGSHTTLAPRQALTPAPYPDCLDRMSGGRRDWAARQFGPAGRMLSDKATCSLDRVAVHAVEIFPWLFGLGQPTPLGLVVSLGDLSNLHQQLRFALGIKENLGLAKVSQGLRGLTPTDSTLMATELLKARLQF